MIEVAGNNTVYLAKFAVLQRVPEYIKITAYDAGSNTVTVNYYTDITGAQLVKSVPFVDAETVFWQITLN